MGVAKFTLAPGDFEQVKKYRQDINFLFKLFFDAKKTFTPGQIQVFVLFHNALDRIGQEYAFPITSTRQPRAYVQGKINCVHALMEALVRAYWTKAFRDMEIYGGELLDIVSHGLDIYEILGTQQTGFYLFRRED